MFSWLLVYDTHALLKILMFSLKHCHVCLKSIQDSKHNLCTHKHLFRETQLPYILDSTYETVIELN